MSVQVIYVKAFNKLYRVELNYQMAGRFILRPITGKPYQTLTATAEQIKKFYMVPIAGRQS